MQVELQVQRIARGHLHGVDRFLRQQGAPQIGVQDRPGEVEHPTHVTAMLAGQTLARPARQYLRGEFDRVELPRQDRLAQVIEQLAQACEQGLAPITFGQGMAGRVAQQAIDGRQSQGLAGGSGRHQALRQTLTA
ncbi:hypothetical protein D3C76_1276000 [compost metagenome]